MNEGRREGRKSRGTGPEDARNLIRDDSVLPSFLPSFLLSSFKFLDRIIQIQIQIQITDYRLQIHTNIWIPGIIIRNTGWDGTEGDSSSYR
jgi:hypothetical protein